MKKSIKLFFVWKKWGPNQWFFEKNSSSLFVQIWSTRRCVDIFLNKWVWRYLGFGDFKVLKKLILIVKLLIKLDRQKIKKNSAHCFGDNYLTNHVIKFLQDRFKPWRVGALKGCTGYHFFKRKLLVTTF